MRKDFHLGQPAIVMINAASTAPMITASAVMIEATIIANNIHDGFLEKAILNEPIVQRQRRLNVICGGTFLALQSPLCLGFHFQLDGCVITDFLFGDVGCMLRFQIVLN